MNKFCKDTQFVIALRTEQGSPQFSQHGGRVFQGIHEFIMIQTVLHLKCLYLDDANGIFQQLLLLLNARHDRRHWLRKE